MVYHQGVVKWSFCSSSYDFHSLITGKGSWNFIVEQGFTTTNSLRTL